MRAGRQQKIDLSQKAADSPANFDRRIPLLPGQLIQENAMKQDEDIGRKKPDNRIGGGFLHLPGGQAIALQVFYPGRQPVFFGIDFYPAETVTVDGAGFGH